MKKLFQVVLLSLLPGLVLAGGSGVRLDKAHIDLSDQESLQRGARLFVNYCLSCHSAQFQRYNRMARDLGLTEDEVKENLMFTTDKIGDTMQVAMPTEQSEVWFGTAPPDLSVVARARGVDWLYTYMRGFYVDEKRPFGVNNTVFPDVGMPHVLWDLQGMRTARLDDLGHVIELSEPQGGTMSSEEYDHAVRDLTAFLSYVGEPIQLERRQLGIWVLLFLAVFFVISVLLKKEYWKDIH